MTTNRFLKQAMRVSRSYSLRVSRSYSRHLPHCAGRWFKWLAPGLLIKRWMFISVSGVLMVVLGAAIWSRLTPVFYIMQFSGDLLEHMTRLLPNYISGPLVLILGLLLVFWGQKRTVGSITEALMSDRDEDLVDVLISHRKLNRGAKLVAIGGGTGLSTLLRGLKALSANITAIVTVADDGGSSGRLRREIGVLPPGDIRNCIAALADEEKLLTELFQYRFKAGDGLVGHSFGNLFLTVLSDITGDFERAIAASSKVLAIRGQVLPATLSDVKLWAELADGRYIEGESNITEARGKIVRMGCKPANPPALPKALDAIEEADYIVIGPGSLYTSVIPNLLVPEIADAIAAREVPCIYICNIMTQPGETDAYSVADHIRAIDQACGRRLFDSVLVQKTAPSPKALLRYAQEQSHPVALDTDAVTQLGRQIIRANIMIEDQETGYVRHDSRKLARVIFQWYERARQ